MLQHGAAFDCPLNGAERRSPVIRSVKCEQTGDGRAGQVSFPVLTYGVLIDSFLWVFLDVGTNVLYMILVLDSYATLKSVIRFETDVAS